MQERTRVARYTRSLRSTATPATSRCEKPAGNCSQSPTGSSFGADAVVRGGLFRLFFCLRELSLVRLAVLDVRETLFRLILVVIEILEREVFGRKWRHNFVFV